MTGTRRYVARFVVVSALSLHLTGSAAWAGTGKVRISGDRKLLDFCVSVRFTATPAQIADIKRAFTDGSAVLLDATDGQFEFGRVDIVNNSGASQQAEVWIHETAGGAVATYGKYGVSGEHINMYFPSNFQQAPARDGDAYTVAHEFAHHIWGLGDEYKSTSGGPAECESAPGSATASYCLMDNYFTRGGNSGGGSTYTLNEFCVGSNHDPDRDTVQEAINSESCWKSIADHTSRGGTAPIATPTDGAPTATVPTFREPMAQRRFVVLLDRSGSMEIRDGGPGTPTRLDLAKQAANIFIDLTKLNDEIGVASFSGTASTNFPLTTITSAGVRTSARTAINALNASGSTAIGSGLITARNMITGASTLSCAQTIILFTDGFGNTGPSELSVVSSLVENDIAVIAIAIGQSVSTANLSSVATSTGGKFFQVQTAADLPPLLASLAAESSGGGVLANQPGFVATGETQTRTILVESATSQLSVVLTFRPDEDMALSLISPSGTRIDSVFAAGSPDVDFLTSPGTRILVVAGSAFEVGAWILNVEGVSVIDGAFVLTSSSDSIDISLVASLEKAQYIFPESIMIQATPSFHLPIVGASVTAVVTRPDDSAELIELLDDGDRANSGDILANDGTYSAIFNSYSNDGSYRFNVVVQTLPGSFTYGGEELFLSAGAPRVENPVPELRREASVTAVVSNVPSNALPTANAGEVQLVECTSPLGASVMLNGSASSDPDGDPLSFTWTGPFGTATGPTPTVSVPLGTYTITLTVDDDRGGSDSDTVEITVQDTTSPTITGASATPAFLWPPNHTMRPVTVGYTATDLCSLATCSLSVASNEPVNGTGDGDAAPDWIISDDHRLQLRAERAGTGNGRTYTTTVSCTDGAGNAATPASTSVIVKHDMGSPKSGAAFRIGSSVSFTGSFWDVPGKTHTGQWFFDGLSTAASITEPTATKAGTVRGTYTFTSTGVYAVKMNVKDATGATGTADAVDGVNALVVIYDPNGGYVTGGGWLDSPAGAYRADPTLAGKVNFGFVSKYFRNATNPKGETEFDFRLAGFKFNALNFDYLVISGPRAQYKGLGKVNGDGGYAFILTVIDGQAPGGGGTDKFRMKIWHKATGVLVYDNQMGAPDNADPVTPVGTGSSIVIQP